MAANFARLQNRVNRAVTGHLADAFATLGPDTFLVIFDEAFQDALGIAAAGPQLIAASDKVAAVTLGTAISVAGKSFIVLEKQPDGTGMTTLILERA